MGTPTELTLQCRPSTIANFHSIFLAGDPARRMQMLQEHLQALEEERKKIEAFKRELPLCMQLLTDAIGSLLDQLGEYKALIKKEKRSQVSDTFTDDIEVQSTKERSFLEEFIPVKEKADVLMNGNIQDDRICGQPDGQDLDVDPVTHYLSRHGEIEKAKAHPEAKVDDQQRDIAAIEGSKLIEGLLTEQVPVLTSRSKTFLHSKEGMGSAFLPFSRDRKIAQLPNSTEAAALPGLALSSGGWDSSSPVKYDESGFIPTSREQMEHEGRGPLARSNVSTATVLVNNSGGSNSGHFGGQRKARRCWSPELHHRFLDALQQLGGSQVATPKQIRELMKVDGLTNDEVKSHLQKYRLHTRRPSPFHQPATPPAPQLVVLGGIWVPPDYAVHAAVDSQQGSSLYNPVQPQLGPSPQNFYSHKSSSNQLQLRLPLYCDQQSLVAAHSGSSSKHCSQHISQSSGENHSSGDAGGEESVGDRKSESSAWKQEGQDK